MKALILGAAALALALPVFAAENAANSPEQQVSQKEYREQKAAKQAEEKAKPEQLATTGVSREVTLEAAPSAKKAEAAKPEERHTLRFESWVHDEDNEY